MKIIILLSTFLPLVSSASEYDFQLHLACNKGDVCADFQSDSGTVSLKKVPDLILDENSLNSVDVTEDQFKQPELNLRLKPEMAQKFSALTEKAVGSYIAIVVGSKVVSQPSVMSKIESESVKLSSGYNEKPFWDDIPWIKAKAAAHRNAIGESNNKSLILYSIICVVLLVAALGYVFRGKNKKAS